MAGFAKNLLGAAAVGVGSIAAYRVFVTSGGTTASATSAPKSKFTATDDYPDLKLHNNVMAHCMTPDIYARLRNLKTPGGYTIDECIQTGVDNPGHPFIKTVGIVAGDEESYSVEQNLATVQLLMG